MTDADDDELVDMIIGKGVKDNPTQRFVRRSNQDVVYVVELDPTKLSTDFADWIEDDLLKLDAMDLRKNFINDYSADLSIQMTNQGFRPSIALAPRSEITLVRNGESDPWDARDDQEVRSHAQSAENRRGMVDDAMAADEEVNQEAITKLVNGLDDLLIVDVARKPEGLSADLKAGKAFLDKEEAISDLVRKGFIPGTQDTGADMLSSEGEVVCTLRNGVEYVLRFGQLKVQTESAAGGEGEEAAAATAATPPAAGAAGADAGAQPPPERTRNRKRRTKARICAVTCS